MCGIAGILRFDATPASRALIQKMTDAIAHRGPDGEGHHTDGPVALGHRRLAIVDLSDAGRQPMQTPDQRHVISYNGELYNFQELRDELEALGHTFRSQTDTEVVLHAYAEWGAACVERFNGMFAFALWDHKTQSLFLARDRYGIKPLYYHRTDERIHIGSEIKALLADPDYRKEVDLHAVREYFTFQNLWSDRTLFSGIRLLPPGHVMTVQRDGTVSTHRYWDYTFHIDDEATPDAMAQEVRDRFERAVERQLMTDVPLGAHLSAGMDSGSVAAVASRHMPRLPTFTGGFDTREADGFEITADEREGAEALSSQLRTEHYEMVMHAGDMRWIMPRLVWHLEDLRMGMSWPNYYIDRLASRFVKVGLTGTGGDELFGGYPWRYAAASQEPERFAESYSAYWQRLMPARDHGLLFRPEIMQATDDFDAQAIFQDVLDDAERLPDDPRDRALYVDLKTFLHGLLVIQDKISMAHGLESRVPFLDNDLVDYALTVPADHKMGDLSGFATGKRTRSNQGKRILRKAMAGLLPDSVIERAKQGFSAPDGSWYRGPSLVYVHETLLGDDSRCTAFVSAAFIKRAIAEHWTGVREWRLLLWSLLSFEWWLRVFDPLPPDTTPPAPSSETEHASDCAPIVPGQARRVRTVPRSKTARVVLPQATVPRVPRRAP